VISDNVTEANHHTMTTAFEGWRDFGIPIADTFPPEMTWRIVGHSAASRSYADKAAFVEQVLARSAAVRLVHADEQRQSCRRRRVLRQHQLQRTVGEGHAHLVLNPSLRASYQC
jgi:hypothetical protein